METDPNLRFALLAHERGMIDASQLAQACAAWTQDSGVALARMMLDRKWITLQQVEEIQTHIERERPAAGGGKRQAPGTAGNSATLDLHPNSEHERVSQTDELPGPQTEPPSEGKKLAVKHDDATHADDHKAPADVPRRTPDSPQPAAAAPDRERTDDEQERSAGHVRKVQLETIELKAESRSHYTLSRVHGKGGLGQVWLAIDSQLNREVALKEVLPEKGQNIDTCSRLVKEAQITGQLEHPNIIPVYELTRGSSDEPPFYTMRFMRGRTLNERIKEYHARRHAGHTDRLEIRQLLSILVGVCNALAYAHSRGIVHRDLKPHNVMLGDFGEVIVIDWGLAKMVDQPDDVSDSREIRVAEVAGLVATIEGKVLGSPAFMSPEQADGKLRLVDARSDIYGLGAILFAILTGHAPHRATSSSHSVKDTMELLNQIATGPTPRARSVDPSVPVALDAICAKAMAKERAKRYAQASELADDIQRWLADEPVSAYREPWRERLLRWMRRHRAWTQAAAAALVVVAVVASVAAIVVNRARRQVENSLVAEQTALGQAKQSLEAETKALAAEREAKDEATRRFKEARDAVDKSLTGVSGVLLYYPGVQPLRTELLKKAAEDYERFAREKSDDLGLRAESGRAFLRLGDVRQLLAQHKEAEQAYRSAESLFDKLCRVEPENAEFAVELAHARTRLGSLYTAIGPHADAEPAFDAALRTLDELASRHPGAVAYRYERAVASLNRVSLLKQTARLGDARALLDQVEGEFRQLTAEDPDPKHAEALAMARRELGQLLGMMGRNDDAAAKLREAILVYVQLGLGQPNHPPYLEGLAATRVDLANALRKLGRDSEAVQAYRTSIADYEVLLHVRPDVPHYREHVALSRTNLAQILHTVGRNADAKADCMAALSEFVDLVNGNPGLYRYHEEQATASATLGTILRDLNEDDLAVVAFRGAVERFGDLAARVPEAPVYRSRLAIARSSLGRTLDKMGQHDAAKTEFLTAIDTFQDVTKEAADDPYSQNGLAWCYTHLGDLLRETEQPSQATACYAKAMALREQLANEPDDMYNLAWFLANCGDLKFRDAERAVRVADDARKKAPENGRYWNMLGTAQYRAGKWDDSIKSLLVAVNLRGQPEHASDWFVMAMAQWQKVQKDAANASFNRAIKIMDEHCPGNIELGKLRQEAAELLEIIAPPNPAKPSPPAPAPAS